MDQKHRDAELNKAMDAVGTLEEFMPWLHKYCRANLWKYRSLNYDLDDLLQEGRRCFYSCRRMYLDPAYKPRNPLRRKIGVVKDKPLFFHLCQRKVKSRFTRLATKDTQSRFVTSVEDVERYDARTTPNLGELLIQFKEMSVKEFYEYCGVAGIAPLEYLQLLRRWSGVKQPTRTT